MKSAITISLTPQARGGPFVFWDDLAAGCAKAAQFGFDGVEIFAPSADALSADLVRPVLDQHKLKLAGVGTGAGWVIHQLTLSTPDASIRAQARQFIRSIVDAGGNLGAPAIVGSMQGRWGNGVSRETAIAWLIEALDDLGADAARHGVPLLFEPLNRYETNLINTQADGLALLQSLKTSNVKLLADLFHMNIEEADLASTIRASAKAIGHVHLADSNRRPAGNGHLPLAPIAAALRDIGYSGFISAECLPWPDPGAAAEKTIDSYRRYFGDSSGGNTRMLRHQLIHPTINQVLGRAGHHARILIADGNYPASSAIGPRAELVSLNLMPGVVSCNQALQAVMSAIPIEAAHTMMYETTGPYALSADPPVWAEYRKTIRDAGLDVPLAPIEKWEFYKAVATPDHVLTIQTADQQRFANLLLVVGVRMD